MYWKRQIFALAMLATLVVPAAAVTRFPTDVSIERGFRISGGLAELMQSDDEYLVVRNGPVAGRLEWPITVVFAGRAPEGAPDNLRLVVESHVSLQGLAQTIEEYDFRSNEWRVLGIGQGTTFDQRLVLPVPDPIRFVGPDRSVLARVRVKPKDIVLSNNWRAYFDQLFWEWQ